MSPETQHLESCFTPADPSQPPPLEDGGYREELEDFTRFFERLSTIDDMTWFFTDAPQESPRDDPQPRTPARAPSPQAFPGKSTATQPKDPAPAAKREPRPQPAEPAGRMQVFRSDVPPPEAPRFDPPIVGAPIPTAAPVQRGGPRMTRRERYGRLAGRIRIAVTVAAAGSLLFAAGLGMGALVLSLPKKSLPTFEVPAQHRPAATATAGQSPAPAGDAEVSSSIAAAAAPALEVVLPNLKGKDGTEVLAEAEPSDGAESDFAASGSLIEATGNIDARAKATAGDTATQPAPAATPAGPRFALQVGACSSYDCVQQFRNLLLGHVDSTVIKVVSAGAIQRVRVEPLERQAALRLKQALVAQDNRLAGAYLIALR